jgi:hypothetical protein
MKKIAFILFFLSFFSFSQTKEFDYLHLSKPDTKNELSIHFNTEIPFKLLKDISYPKNKYTLNVSFLINKLREPYQINTSFKVSNNLYNAIKKALLNFPLEKLNLKSLDTKVKYSFQIIASAKKHGNIFYCSSLMITETLPICNSCEDLEYYGDIKNCINEKIKTFYYKNTDSSAVIVDNTKRLKIKLKINEKGKLILLKEDGFDLLIEKTTKKPISFKVPASINNNATFYDYAFYPSKNKKEHLLNTLKEIEENSTNDFAKFIAQKLDRKYILNSGLSRINKNISLHFELDKKGKPINIKTNSRSYSLDKKIIQLFKEFPFQKLNLGEKNPLTYYLTSILSFKEGKTVVATNPKLNSESIPIFPGCDNSKEIKEAQKCFSIGVQKHFARKFNTSLPNRLGLSSGRKKVLIAFKINKDGDVTDIKVKAPHKKIKKEVIRVIKKLPKMKPGVQNGEKKDIKYSIPFTLIVK